MANRRMFSLKIIDTDEFMDMSQTAQLLYYNLAMRADDDGFVSNPKRIMKMTGINDDDFKVLIAKQYIIPFQKGICVIKHWRIHNYIQKDRYQETNYIKEKKQLEVKENGEYKIKKGKCIQNVSKMDTQVRIELGKERKGKSKVKSLSAKADGSSNRDLKEFIIWCKKSTQRHIHIIADYADEKKMSFETKDQWQQFLKRNLRPARSLAPYSDEQIGEAMRKLNEAKKDYLTDWTLETLLKFLDK